MEEKPPQNIILLLSSSSVELFKCVSITSLHNDHHLAYFIAISRKIHIGFHQSGFSSWPAEVLMLHVLIRNTRVVKVVPCSLENGV